MEAEIKGFKGTILLMEGTTVSKSSFDKPRVVYYNVKLYDADKKLTMEFINVYPQEIKILNQ